jgi:hypothetical protein
MMVEGGGGVDLAAFSRSTLVGVGGLAIYRQTV